MADIVKIVGIRDYDFVAQETGQRITGRKYYAAVSTGNPRVQGLETKEYSASTALMATWVLPDSYNPQVGDYAEVVYSRYGRLERFRLIPDSPGLSDLFMPLMA